MPVGTLENINMGGNHKTLFHEYEAKEQAQKIPVGTLVNISLGDNHKTLFHEYEAKEQA